MTKFQDKKVAVLGLGIEGKDAVKYLTAQGAKVTVFDQKEIGEIDQTGLEGYSYNLVGGSEYLNHLSDFSIIVRSPGIYRLHPQIIAAEKAGSEITSSIKIFMDEFKGKVIGVTGTKGKGTTSTLTYEILKTAGRDVYLAGNIGTPPLELLEKTNEHSWIILELSSFQLIDLHKSPYIGVVLNITVDHLDWHKDRDEYVEAKTGIVKYQTLEDFAVINYDYASSRDFANKTRAKVYYFSRKENVKGCFVNSDKQLVVVDGDKKLEIGDASKLLLRGEHNWENVCAATCAAYLAEVEVTDIQKAVFDFKGLEHRLELVGEIAGVRYYNDSFSTNPQTTIAAIQAFLEPMILILGGSDKGLDYKEMAQEIASSKNIKGIVLIGQIADQIEQEIKNTSANTLITNLGMTTMSEIFSAVQKLAESGDVVVLSPATASFGMFKDYKDRGKQFKAEVKGSIN